MQIKLHASNSDQGPLVFREDLAILLKADDASCHSVIATVSTSLTLTTNINRCDVILNSNGMLSRRWTLELSKRIHASWPLNSRASTSASESEKGCRRLHLNADDLRLGGILFRYATYRQNEAARLSLCPCFQ